MRFAAAHVLEREPEAAHVRAQHAMRAVDVLAARLGVLAALERVAHGVDAAADPVPGLDHDHLVPGPPELVRRGEPGEAGADDHHPPLVARLPPLAEREPAAERDRCRHPCRADDEPPSRQASLHDS